MKSFCLNISLALIVITVTGCATPRHADTKSETLDNVTFTACLPKRNAAGDQVLLHLKLENQRSKGIGVYRWEKGIDISVSNAAGAIVGRTEAGKNVFRFELPKGTSWQERAIFERSDGPNGLLHPGQSIETTIDLAQLFALTPGKYTLTVSAVVLPGGQPALRFQIQSLAFRIDSTRRQRSNLLRND